MRRELWESECAQGAIRSFEAHCTAYTISADEKWQECIFEDIDVHRTAEREPDMYFVDVGET